MTPIGLLASRPLIDFDGTLLLQFGLFLLVYLVLKNWVIAPYLHIRSQRDAHVKGALEEASVLAKRSEGLRKAYQEELELIRRQLSADRQGWIHEQQLQEQTRRQQWQSQLQMEWDRERAQLEHHRVQAAQMLSAQVPEVTKALLQQLLGREVSL